MGKKTISEYVEVVRLWLTPFFSAVGIFVSILALLKPNVIFKIIFLIILLAYVLVILSSLITAFCIYKLKVKTKEYELEISEKNKSIDSIGISLSDIKKNTLAFYLLLNKKTNTVICNM